VWFVKALFLGVRKNDFAVSKVHCLKAVVYIFSKLDIKIIIINFRLALAS
jgi:hypothetical protein